MKKNLLIALALAGCAYLASRPAVQAAGSGFVCAIPKAWGRVVDASPAPAFEATDGTIRVLNSYGCDLHMTITRN